jgi:hypothetical protein
MTAQSLPKRIAPCIVEVMWAGFALAAVVVSLAETSPSPASGPPCPDPSEVEAHMVRLGVEGGRRPEITVLGDKMRVVLRGQDGLTLGSREVEAPASCHERATVAAVLVATWMGVWPAAASPAIPSAPPSSKSAPAQPATTKPARANGTEIGLTLMSAYDGNALALGLAAETRWHLLGPLRGFVALTATTEREKSVGVGHAAYLRPSVEAGPSLGLGSHKVRGEIGLSGRLGLLILRGKDLPITHVTTRAVPGLGAALRLVFVGNSLSPFVTAGGAYWFGRESVKLDDDPATAELPRWDAQVGVGILWARGP